MTTRTTRETAAPPTPSAPAPAPAPGDTARAIAERQRRVQVIRETRHNTEERT